MCTSTCSNRNNMPTAKGIKVLRLTPLSPAGRGAACCGASAPPRRKPCAPSCRFAAGQGIQHLPLTSQAGQERAAFATGYAGRACLRLPNALPGREAFGGRGFAPGWPLQRGRCNAAGRRYSSPGSPSPVRRTGVPASQGTARRLALVPSLTAMAPACITATGNWFSLLHCERRGCC